MFMTEYKGETRGNLRKITPEPQALQLIPEVMARKYVAIPLSLDGKVLRVAMANPDDILAIEALASRSEVRIEPEAASAEEIFEAIDFNYKAYDEIEKQVSNISFSNGIKLDRQMAVDSVADAPVAQALTLIIDEAVKARASDIHLQPGEDKIRVRYRIDGALQDMFSLPHYFPH